MNESNYSSRLPFKLPKRRRKVEIKIFFILLVLLFIFYVSLVFYSSKRKRTIKDGSIYIPEADIILEDGLTEDAKRFIKELKLENPGENGEALNFNVDILTDEHWKHIVDDWKEYGFSRFTSDLISANRIIADNRSDYCKEKIYSKNLPKVSIVTSFYNEAWSILVRMLHSIILNTPWELIEEIILVDDFSDREHLKEPLEEYCEKLKKVKIIRSHKRLGVAGGRDLGFRNAKGPVILSIDSHIEATPGWLEPLLDRLKDNPKLVTYGSIKWLDSDTLEAAYDQERALVVFKFDFTFVDLPMDTYEPQLNYWEPHKSPLMPGGIFAFWKDFGESIGFIDPEFDYVGYDDVDFGLKTWLCHGSIEFIPCSAILHLRRSRLYKEVSPDKNGILWNSDRIVESWFDDNYKKFYYRIFNDTKTRNFGDISENLKIKEKLKCKSFSWYIENVYPDVEIPDEIKDENWMGN